MQTAPVRPEGIPPAARFDPELGGFEIAETDEHGRRSGECRVFRATDGTLDWVCTYREGVRDGPFTRFHPNGQTAQRGRFAQGILDGEVVAYASDGATDLLLQPCCVPPGAWELRSRYHGGRLVRQVFYDREGWPLTRAGTRWPARPATVDPDAEYDDDSGLWLLRNELDERRLLLRRYTADGVPLSETEYHYGKKTRERRLNAAGLPRDEHFFDDDGLYHGPSTRWFTESHTPYPDGRIREERGQFWHGQPVGSFTWLDQETNVVARRELGAGLTDATLMASEVFAPELDHTNAEQLWELTEHLLRARRVREAVVAAARASARAGSAERLGPWLDRVRLAVTNDVATEIGEWLVGRPELTPNDAISALLLGADVPTALRTLAGLLGRAPGAAMDLAEAAVLFAPEAVPARITRALLRLERGWTALVLEDAAHLESAAPYVSEHLRRAVRAYFPEFRFRPHDDVLDPVPEDTPDVDIQQPLDRIRRQVGVYATRLVRLAALSRERLGDARSPWAWPDLGHLLPDGPIELERTTALVEDETENGVEVTEISIDEALGLDGESVLAIATAVRGTWAALCWLCWAVGLDAVALPDAIRPRSEFAAAANMAFSRYARSQDQTRTGGLLSRARGVPDFVWEGTNITELDRRFVPLPLAEYTELRALFFWLMFEQNVSPFQSDIRAA